MWQAHLIRAKGYVASFTVGVLCFGMMSYETYLHRPFDLNDAADWNADRIIVAANSGNPEAMHLAGIGYQNALFGFQADNKQALFWYLKGAQKGVKESSYNAGSILFRTNPALGFRLLLSSANDGCVDAQAKVGEILLKGLGGVPRNPVEGARWTALAAQNGDRVASYNLGVLYETGIILKKDMKESESWMSRFKW